ncbi:MAG: adhesion regulating molecule 1 [Icmadophila ericetorum]|nr:adhesion regulating molecule 1 [Icmadophila ericetorum]
MSITPIITFKAGICDLDSSTTPPKILPQPQQGYIYLYSEDDLVHFCWRPRTTPHTAPQLDLVMVPSDGHFVPYQHPSPGARTNGRIYVLKFSSSSQRNFFWLQSRTQHPQGDPSFFSPRDLKLGQIVDQLLQGEEVNVEQEIANLPSNQGGPHGDDDQMMEDVEETGYGDHHRSASGGAGADATGGDVREEGEEAREGGADGGRAAVTTASDTMASSVVADFLRSLQGNKALQGQAAPVEGKLFTTLPELLPPSTTLPIIDSAEEARINKMVSYLPPEILQVASGNPAVSSVDQGTERIIQRLSLDTKKDILRKTLHSPQFSQSLSSLTMALRLGGLPSISEALQIKVKNGGFVGRAGVPMGQGDAVEAFVEGTKTAVEEEESSRMHVD